MKRIVYIFIFYMISCNHIKDENNIGGYYLSKNDSEIYYFNKNKVVQYNFIDSTSTKHDLTLNKKSIIVRNEQYKIKQYDSDSLLFYNINGKKIHLRKFNFMNFNINDLNKSNWLLNFIDRKGNSKTQFLKINNQTGIHFFSKIESSKDTMYSHKIPYRGKFFDKFNVYSLYNISILNFFVVIFIPYFYF